MIKSVGLIGYGHFGAFLHTLANVFVPDLEVRAYARKRIDEGAPFCSLEEAAGCDVVILTVPISRYEEVLETVIPHLKPGAIVVDVATVKLHTVRLLQAKLTTHRFISMHPMFGPESYSKRNGDVSGFRLVVTDMRLEEHLYRVFSDRVCELGFSLVEMSADEHDQDLAETLFLTHYVGQVIARGGFERTDIDTVSFGYLMDAVDSVRHDTQLFEDVCRYNPHCAEVIKRFTHSQRQVRALLPDTLPEI